jgi:hypothetical protein
MAAPTITVSPSVYRVSVNEITNTVTVASVGPQGERGIPAITSGTLDGGLLQHVHVQPDHRPLHRWVGIRWRYSLMAVQIQIRRGTAANWTSANPTLAEGELGYETDTGKLKAGDGSTRVDLADAMSLELVQVARSRAST